MSRVQIPSPAPFFCLPKLGFGRARRASDRQARAVAVELAVGIARRAAGSFQARWWWASAALGAGRSGHESRPSSSTRVALLRTQDLRLPRGDRASSATPETPRRFALVTPGPCPLRDFGRPPCSAQRIRAQLRVTTCTPRRLVGGRDRAPGRAESRGARAGSRELSSTETRSPASVSRPATRPIVA